MTLKETLDLLRWSHCTICTSDPFDKELKIYKPTQNYDELGVTYLRILPLEFLNLQVDYIRPTAYNYVNVFVKNANE